MPSILGAYLIYISTSPTRSIFPQVKNHAVHGKNHAVQVKNHAVHGGKTPGHEI